MSRYWTRVERVSRIRDTYAVPVVRRPTLRDFDLEDVLGAGSFATVWSATDKRLDRRVAIKILADNWAENADVRRRFLAEARLLVTAESPRLVRGFAAGETDDGVPYLVMALADRGTLGERIQERRLRAQPFSVYEACSIGKQLAEAVADVHALGHLHRDIKPRNVLLTTASPGRERQPTPGLEPDERLVLGDFGFVRGLDASALTLVGGSPGFVAPEQASGLVHIDERADVYSIGVVVLTLLIGDTPALPTTMAQAANTELDAASLLAEARPDIDAESIRAVCRLLAVRPQDRPASAAEAVDVLGEAAARTRDVPAPPQRPAVFAAPPVPGSTPPVPESTTATVIRPPAARHSPAVADPGATLEPDSIDQGTGRNRRVAMVGVVSAVVVALAVLAGVVASGTFGDKADDVQPSISSSLPTQTEPDAPSSTPVGEAAGTTVPLPAASSAPTVAPSTMPPVSVEPPVQLRSVVGFPLPTGVVVDSDDDFRTVADVALAPGDVIAFYRSLSPDWNVTVEPVEADGRQVFEVTGPDVVASVSVAATALSTGSDITNIVIRYAA